MEKKILTVGFADMTNFDKLMNSEGTERTLEILQEAYELVGDIIIKHGGQIRKYIGDAILFTFDDPEEGTRAAEEIAGHRREIKDLTLRHNVSIATGEVTLVEVGHPQYRVKDIFGETVNRAAKLLREAARSELGFSLCEETRRRIQSIKQ